MGALFVILCVLLVLAIAAIAVWLWLFADIIGQVNEIVRIKVDEHIALLKIQSLSRIARAEQERLHTTHSQKNR